MVDSLVKDVPVCVRRSFGDIIEKASIQDWDVRMVLRCMLWLLAGALFITGIAGAQSDQTEHGRTEGALFYSNMVSSQPKDTLVFICHPDWHAGDAALEPDSGWNQSLWTRGIILSDMRRYGPKYILIAGDIIGGKWLGERREELTKRFAPGGTDSELVLACSRVLYESINQQFREFGMEPIAALGDHDLGDQNWIQGSRKADVVGAYKQAFSEAYTLDALGKPKYDGFIGNVPQRPVGTGYENTSYAFVDKNVLFVTVDIFRFEGSDTTLDKVRGVLAIELAPEQEAWLDALLMEAAAIEDIQFTVVQAHCPVLIPMRKFQTSSITVNDQANSSFWKLLQKHKVDVYISGEVHAFTPLVDTESQVVHIICGSFISNTAHNYLVCRASDQRLEIIIREKTGDGSEFVYETTGKMIIDKASGQKVISGLGKLEPIDSNRILFHYAFDQQDLLDGVHNSGQFGSRLYRGIPSNLTLEEGFLGKALVIGREVPGYFHTLGLGPTDNDCPRTVVAWVKTGQTTKGTIWALGNDDYCLYLNNGILELDAEGVAVKAVQDAHLNDRAWHHIAAVFPGGPAEIKDVRLYIDGEEANIETDRPHGRIRTSVHREVYVGAHHDAANPYQGSMDDLALWVSALAESEIASLHRLGRDSQLRYNAAQVDSLFGLFRKGTGDITVKGIHWEPVATRRQTTSGNLVLNQDGQYELIFDDEGNGLRTVNLRSEGSEPRPTDTPAGR
jgi:hypothetical protein